MTGTEIIAAFREENPEITSRVVTDAVLTTWLKEGNVNVSTRCRLIVGEGTFNSVVDVSRYDMTNEIEKFFDIDEIPGGGVSYDDKRLDHTTIAELDRRTPSWRTASSGTPRQYYRRGQYIYFEKPPVSIKEIKVYAVLTPDDFTGAETEPFNQLTYLRPFHYSLVFYLTMRAKMKVGKDVEQASARAEFEGYINWVKKEIGGGKYGTIQFVPQNKL